MTGRRPGRRYPPAVVAPPLAQRAARRLVRLARGPYYYDWNFYPRIARDDVYLVSYPRSGSTWLRALLASFLRDEPVTPTQVQETIPEIYKSRPAGTIGRRHTRNAPVLKSHSPYVRIPAKVIYLVRDGRDTTLSYFYYLRKQSEHQPDAPIHHETAADFFLSTPPSPFGTWHDHVLGWLNGLESWSGERYLILRYEEVLAEPERELERVLRFAGVEPDAGRIARSVSFNEKETLAAMEQTVGAGAWEYPGLTRARWQTVLSPPEVAQYEELAGTALIRSGYALASGGRPAPVA